VGRKPCSVSQFTENNATELFIFSLRSSVQLQRPRWPHK